MQSEREHRQGCIHTSREHCKDFKRSSTGKKLSTEFYTSWYQKIDNGEHKRKSFPEFYEHRLQYWDKIFREIETKGCKKSKNQRDNVEIAINGRGQCLLIDGRHRVAFADILKLKQIPVTVNIVSETLVKLFKDETLANSFANRNTAEAFAANSTHFARQLRNEDIKDRLVIASMGTWPFRGSKACKKSTRIE